MQRIVADTTQLYRNWHKTSDLDVVFQPLVHIPSGKPFAYEALSRPRIGPNPIPVGLLLESASNARQLSDFDRIAFPTILQTALKLDFPPHLKLFVNFSPFTLLDSEFILQTLAKPGIGIDASQLVIEISEREALPGIDLVELLAPYRRQGISVALDDFGAGYSGLTRVVDLNPDYAKIDLGLVHDIDKNAVKYALVESTVQFASRSGHLAVLAEGIESPAELATLYELGVTLGQGYLLGRPEAHLQHQPHQVPLELLTRRLPESSELMQAFITTTHRMVDGEGIGEGFASHIVHLAARFMAADQVVLWRSEGKELVVDYAFPELPSHLNRLRLDPDNPSYQAMTERRSIVLQTPEECAKSRFAVSLDMQSLLIVPVTDRNQTHALLTVSFRRPLQIRPQEIQMIEGLARLIALVTTTTPMVVPDAGGVGEPVFEAMSSLMASGDLESLLAKVMEAALSVSGAHMGYIGVLTPDSLHAVTADGEVFDIPKFDIYDPQSDVGRGPIGQSLRERRMVVVQNIAADPTMDPWRQEMLADGIQSALAIPLVTPTGVLGLLKVYHSHDHGFEVGRVRRLEALASLTTVLIDNWQEEHYETRRWLREKTAAVIDIIGSLTSDESTTPAYQRIEDTVRQLLDGQSSGVLRFENLVAIPVDPVSPVASGLWTRIIAGCERVRESRRVHHEPISDNEALFVMPLLIAGKAVGAIWVVHDQTQASLRGTVIDLLTPPLLLLSVAGAAAILLDHR